MPTPVAYPDKANTIEKAKPNYLSMSAKERVVLYSSDQKIPQFASENPSCKSQFSDLVEPHTLTEIDDYDIDDNLSSIVLSIKKQNDTLLTKIRNRNNDTMTERNFQKKGSNLDLAGSMDANLKHKIMGVPLSQFKTPEVSKFKNKTMAAHMVSPEKQHLGDDQEHLQNMEYIGSKPSLIETEDGDFERDEASEVAHRLNVSEHLNKSEISSACDLPDQPKTISEDEYTLMRS